MSERRFLPTIPISILVLLLTLPGFSSSQVAAQQADPTYVPGQVIVKFKPGAAAGDIDRILDELGASRLKTFRRIGATLERIDKMDVQQAVAVYRNHPALEYIEPDYILHADLTPNDPSFDLLWGLHNIGQTGGTLDADIDAPEAWDEFTGSDAVIVGVIDTGVDYNHLDLLDNMWTNPGEIPGNGVDDDSNGYIDDVYGIDAYNGDTDPIDDHSHGTHCSGTVGAVGDNAVGVVGVSWNVKIMALKFLSSFGSGPTSAAIECVEYATMMGANLTSNSWGGGGYSDALEDAINDAYSAGILFVAAAGNYGDDNDLYPHYPSSYPSPGIIAVGATDHNDARVNVGYWASNYGPTSVDLGAPGLDIYSTMPGNSYDYKGGTSMATPHVSGAVALIKGRFPDISADAAKTLILNSADVIPELEGLWVTGGRLNAWKALEGPDSIPPDPVLDLMAANTTSTAVLLQWTASGDDGPDGNADNYDVRYATFPIDTLNFYSATQAAGEPQPGPPGQPEQMLITGLDFDTTYYFALMVLDEYGNRSPLSNVDQATTPGPPAGTVTPDSLYADLLTGETDASQIVTISNSGVSDLEWSIEIEGITPGSVTFTKEDYADWTLPENQDRITDNVWITRANTQGIFNAATESYYSYFSPDGTEWAYGLTEDLDPEDYHVWRDAVFGYPPGMVGQPISVHLIADDLYFDVMFHSWTPAGGGGGFSYTRTGMSAAWLEVSQMSGIVPPGGSVDVSVIFSAAELCGGDYLADIMVLSNDPTAPSSRVATHLHVTGEPDIALSTDALDYGGVFIGAVVTDTLVVSNPGCDLLSITEITSDLAEFTVTPVSFDLAVGESRNVLVTYAPTEAVISTGLLAIASNDPDEPVLNVTLTGAGLVPPVIAVSPDSLAADLLTGEVETQQLAVANSGGSDLVFNVSIEGATTAGMLQRKRGPSVQMAQMQAQAAERGETTGSEKAVSPNQTDPTERPVVLAGEYQGDHLNFGITDYGEIMPFQYPVGNEHLALGTWLSGYTVAYLVGSLDNVAYASYDNRMNLVSVSYQELVNSPEQVIVEVVTQTTDGVLQIVREITFQRDSKFLRTQTSIQNLSGSAVQQVVFKSYADWDVDGVYDNNWDYDFERNMAYAFLTHYATIASQQVPDLMDLDGWSDYYQRQTIVDYPTGPAFLDGVEILHFELGDLAASGRTDITTAHAVANDLVELQGVVDSAFTTWLYLDTYEGVVPAGETQFLDVTFDASELCGGLYDATINIRNNDPLTPQVVVPTHLVVTGEPDIAVTPDSLDFGGVFVGAVETRSLWVANPGCDLLAITDIVSDHADFSVAPTTFDLNVGDAQEVIVTYTPGSAGVMAGTLTITSNDPDEPALTIPVLGEGLIPPEIVVTPDSLYADMLTGEIETQVLNLANQGGSDLFWSVDILPAEAGVMLRQAAAAVLADLTPSAQLSLDGVTVPGFTDEEKEVLRSRLATYASTVDQVNTQSVVPLIGVGGDVAWDMIAILLADPELSAVFAFELVNFHSDDLSHLDGLIIAGGDAEMTLSGAEALRAFHEAGKPIFLGMDDLDSNWSGSIPGLLGPVFGIVAPQDGDFCAVGEVNPGHPVTSGLPGFTPDGWWCSDNDYYELDTAEWLFRETTSSRIYGVANEGTGRAVLMGESLYGIWYANEELNVNAVLWMMEGASWLSVEPVEGILPAGSNLDLAVTFDASQLCGGDYLADLLFVNNDPLAPELRVATHMHLTGEPDIAVSDTLLDYGAHFIGAVVIDTLLVSNPGCDLLSITEAATDHPDFTVAPASFDLAVGASQVVEVTFAPTDTVISEGTLTIASNDPDEPVVSVALRGEGLLAPEIAVTPDSLYVDLLTGEVDSTQVVTITNNGGSDLEWVLSIGGDMPGGVTVVKPDYADWTQPEYQDRITDNVWITRADAAGIFNAATESYYNYLSPDDTEWAYGSTEDLEPGDYQVWRDAVGGFPPGMVGQMISVHLITDDLYFDILFHSWTAGGAGGGFSYTRWPARPSWIEAAPLSGTVPAGGHTDVQVIFSAAELCGGDYLANLTVFNNDPLSPEIVIGAHMHVTGEPDIAVSDSVLAYGSVYIGAVVTDTVVVANPGCDLLSVSEITSNHPDYTVAPASFDLAVGESQDVLVSFAPSSVGVLAGQLAIVSNDPDEPLITVELTGEGLVPPEIVVTPDSFYVELLPAHSETRLMTIANNGASDLTWEAFASFADTSAVLQKSPVFGPGEVAGDPKTLATAPPPRPEDDLIYRSRPVEVGKEKGSDQSTVGIHDRGEETTAGTAVGATANPGVRFTSTLEDILENLNLNFTAVNGVIPNRFDFTGGETGTNISDGGGDMYDGGNYLSTDLGGPLYYSDDVIVDSSFFGSAGRYFTRKYPGLFVLGADLNGVDYFEINGNLGADGSGSADGVVLETSMYGRTYQGFVKRVYSAYDPSVNHLIIVEQNPAVQHEFSTNTNDDYHRVFNLGDSVRIYYLLYAGDDGYYIDDAATLQIMNAFLGAIDLAPSWLAIEPSAGTVPPGAATDVQVTFTAPDDCGGDYLADLLVVSNDPLAPVVVVDTHLHLLGEPGIAVSDSLLAYGPLYLGDVATDSVLISNVGCDTLHVFEVSSSHPDFLVTPASFDLSIDGSQWVQVTFAPASAIAYDDSLTIISDDPAQAYVHVALTGEGLVPPEVEISPDSLVADLVTGEVVTRNVAIENTGGSDLIWWVETVPADSTAALSEPADLTGVNILQDTGHGQAALHMWGTIRTDVIARGATVVVDALPINAETLSDFDILWINDCSYTWTAAEIAAVTDWVTAGGSLLLEGDTGNSVAAFNLFLTQLGAGIEYIAAPCTGGVTTNILPHQATLGIESILLETYGQAQLAPAVEPAGLLITDASGVPVSAYSHVGQGRIVALADQIMRNTSIVFEDNRPFANQVFDWLTNPVSWLRPSPDHGTVVAGGVANVDVVFDATGICSGDYLADLVFHTNDPDEPDLTVATFLHVTGFADIQVTPDSLVFGEQFVGATVSDTVLVANSGCDLLAVSDIVSSHGDFAAAPTSFDLPIGSMQPVVITFQPSSVGTITATVTIMSNDPDESSYEITLEGTGVTPPVLTVEPTSLHEDLDQGQSVTRTLAIGNLGGSYLDFALSLGLPDTMPSVAAKGSAKSADIEGLKITKVQSVLHPPTRPNSGTVYFDDMEHGVGDWSTEVYWGEDIWHLTQLLSHSPTTAWWCGIESQGNYNTGTRVWTAVISPEIDLRISQAPITLTFWENFNTEISIDQCKVEASNDGGATWTALRLPVSGTSSGWVETSLDLSAFAGDMIQVRFYFDTLHALNNDYLGWFFDDVQVTAAVGPWVQMDPIAGTVAPDSVQAVAVTFDATGLSAGDYLADIIITTNDPVAPNYTVPVSLTVSGVLMTVAVDVTVGTAADPGNLLGMAEDASDGYDPEHDLPEPPSDPVDYVSGYFPHPEWSAPVGERFQSDIRAPYDPELGMKSWPFEVETDQAGTVTLAFTPSFDAAIGWGLWIRDEVSGETHDLFPTLNYQYESPGAGTHAFTIMVGRTLPLLEPPARDLVAGWSLVSAPLVPPAGQDTWADVLLDDATGTTHLFSYDPAGGYTQLNSAAPVQQGQGLWVATSEGFSWSMAGTENTGEIVVPLHEGWTLCGYPLWFPGSLVGVTVDHAGDLMSWNEAVAAGLVAGSAFAYDTVSGAYQTVTDLAAWQGYWFAGYVSDLSLRFLYQNMLDRGVSPPAAGEEEPVSSDHWLVRMGMADSPHLIRFGMRVDATDGFDAAHDLPMPPLSPDGTSVPTLAFMRPEWNLSTGDRFMTDLVAPSAEPRQWRMQVERPEPGEVTLYWDSGAIPDGRDFQIYLPGENRVVVTSMRNEAIARIEVGDEPVMLEIRTPDHLTDVPAQLAGLDLRNAPNPFNPSTEFRFNLPREGEVEIRIYSVRGALIRSLREGRRPAGPTAVRWQGRDAQGARVASGTYFYRLYLDGRQEGPTLKMSMVK